MQDGAIVPSCKWIYPSQQENEKKLCISLLFPFSSFFPYLFFPFSSFPSFFLESSLFWPLSFYLFGTLGGDCPHRPLLWIRHCVVWCLKQKTVFAEKVAMWSLNNEFTSRTACATSIRNPVWLLLMTAPLPLVTPAWTFSINGCWRQPFTV
jgi:hypothetical protein